MSRRMIGVMGLVVVMGTGCAVRFATRSPWDVQQLAELSDQLEQFKTLARLKADEAEALRRAKEQLEQGISSNEVSVGYDARGLVTRMLDPVLFDSGKATLRRSAHPVLDQVATVLSGLPDQPVGVEGHTDNEPIKHSGWADNQALSLARANAVVAYLVERHGIGADRVTPIGYGETRPVAANDTREGRQQNRRVEIVILPKAAGPSYEAHADRLTPEHAGYSK